jgi:dihydrolipoamide dehydrogenase
MSTEFDVVVIGAGPGGYVAAIRASQLGLKTAIIERENLGGICLNWGCIPTKALLKSGKIIERSRGVAKTMSSGIAFLMKKHKIEVVEGEAKLEKGSPSPKVVVALKAGGSRTIQAKSVILASGARAREIAAIGAVSDGDKIWTYRDALAPKTMPKSLVVIGSGAIGIEFASFYRALGAEVTVVEAVDRIMPVEDAEVSKAAQKAFEKRGITFRIGAKVTKVEKTKDGVSVAIEVGGKAETLTAAVCIVAVGIAPNTEGLDAIGLNMDRGHVVTGKHGETNVPGLYAIGAAAAPRGVPHTPPHEGIHAAEHIAGYKTPAVNSPIPGCTYANPQVASVGLTEAAAKAAGIDVKAGRFPFRVNGKAVAAGEIEGFVKTVFDGKTGALIGAHMIGHEVTEMIQGFVTAITLEATEEDLHGIVYAHPTMSEAMHEAALDAYGRVLHI